MVILKVIIVGAGMGGLAVGIGLARNGHQITIYERLDPVSEIIYALRITSKSDGNLKYLGIDTIASEAVAANSSRLKAQGHVVRGFSKNNNTENAKRGTSVFAYRVQCFTNF